MAADTAKSQLQAKPQTQTATPDAVELFLRLTDRVPALLKVSVVRGPHRLLVSPLRSVTHAKLAGCILWSCMMV